jgi:RNA polymerase sigma-70 factor (ECF subfamily)
MSTPISFDEVYAACHRQVYALCRNLIGNRADALDALQETFIAVARALPAFRGESRVETWVHRIAIRCALRVKSTARPQRTEPLDLEVTGTDSVDPALRREAHERLARAMDALSFEHRLVISLFAIDGLSHQEIASTLGVPLGTIWSRLHTAKQRLVAAMQAD